MANLVRIYKAMLHGAGDLRLEEETFDPASLAPSEILVQTEVTGFSTGTDLGNYEGRSTEVPGAPDYPRAVGYSNVGAVAAAGKAVRLFQPGDRIFGVKPHRSAYVTQETDPLLVPIPAGAPSDQAALAYLIHLGVASLRQVHYEAGENVCVVGLGVIGLCTVAVARAMGARVIAIANSPARAAIAERLGAFEVLQTGAFDPAAICQSQRGDIVVLTANSWEAYRESMEMVNHGGRVTVLGFPGRAQQPPAFNPLDARWLYGKQLTIQGAGHLPRIECPPGDLRFNLRRNLAYVLSLLATGDLNVGPVLSHRFPYHQMREAYELAAIRSKDFSAAVFDWQPA